MQNVATDLPVHEAMQALACLWLLRLTFLFAFFFVGCPCCGACTVCSGGTAPSEFQIIIPTLTNSGCSNCADYSGTFVVQRESGGTEWTCQWRLTVTSTCTYTCPTQPGLGICDMDTLKLGVMLFSPNHIINVWWEYGGQIEPSTNANNWQENYGASAPDCNSFASEEIGNLSISNSSACTSPADKVLVTAL